MLQGGSVRKKFWHFLGREQTRVPQNTVVGAEVDEDFPASGMALAMAELDMEGRVQVSHARSSTSTQNQENENGPTPV